MALTCDDAERAISRSLDLRLSRGERELLRSHLRVCTRCRAFERIHRTSRAALHSFERAPVPDRLCVGRLGRWDASLGPMGILNRRNAVLGWATWQVSKSAAKRKAKQSVKPNDRRPGKRAIAGTLAAAGGALWFWRRRRGDSESD